MIDTTTPQRLAEYVDGLPNLSGEEGLIAATIAEAGAHRIYSMADSEDPFAGIQSAFTIALHMHQPLIRDSSSFGGESGVVAGRLMV